MTDHGHPTSNRLPKVLEKLHHGFNCMGSSAFGNRTPTVMLTLYKSMVRSRLKYCCPVWNPVKISDIQKLENVQRCFVRKIAGIKDILYGLLGPLEEAKNDVALTPKRKILHHPSLEDNQRTCFKRCSNAVQDSLPAWDQGTNPTDKHQSPDICSK